MKKKIPNNKTQKYLKTNPPPPPKFSLLNLKEKEISGQKSPAELKCLLHGKDKHTSNTTFEFILSTPLNCINGNHDLDISIAVLF